jgi:hypothetical protein
VSARISVHSKRYFRVVLESINPDRESAESFAIKLAMRTRTSLPRVRQVVRRLPCPVKQGVSVAQANALKSVLEGIGGKARIESYLETPGLDTPQPQSKPVHLGHDEADEVVVELRNCAVCGWALEEGSESCSFCREGTSPEGDVNEGEAPTAAEGETPAAAEKGVTEVVVSTERPRVDLVTVLRENKFLVAAGLLVILLVIAIIKQ